MYPGFTKEVFFFAYHFYVFIIRINRIEIICVVKLVPKFSKHNFIVVALFLLKTVKRGKPLFYEL